MTPYAFFDLDGTLIDFRGACPNLADIDINGFSSFRRQLKRATDQYGLKAVAVSNMPASQEMALLQLLFGTSCAGVHWAESGAVTVRIDQYRTEVNESFVSWCRHERPQVLSHLAEDGLTDFEAGVEVNIILVNRELRQSGTNLEFRRRVKASVERMPDEMRRRLQLSFGQDGHLADIRPGHLKLHGWSKLTAFEQFSLHYPDIRWSQVCYAGDTDSDADIMQAIGEHGGYLIAVDNATPKVKEVTAKYGGCVSSRELIHGAFEGLYRFTEERLRTRCGSSSSKMFV